jgi:phage shock protein PspC (stress-responsive transcriptional regulator)
MNATKKLYRDDYNKMIGGVCKGLADYFDIDVSIVRALFLLTLIFKGGGVIVYIVLMIVLPKKPFAFGTPGVDYTVPPVNDFDTPPVQPQSGHAEPFVYQPRRKSNFSLIAGLLLVLLGGILLLDEYDIIPDWDFEHLWPVPLVIIGIALIFTSAKKDTLNPKSPIE